MSWEQLADIAKENANEMRRKATEPPVACPIDGMILEIRGNIRNCPMGNFRWP